MLSGGRSCLVLFGSRDVNYQATLPAAFLCGTTVMSLETVRDLSVPDLLHILSEKLNMECMRMRLSPAMSVALLESEVSRS